MTRLALALALLALLAAWCAKPEPRVNDDATVARMKFYAQQIDMLPGHALIVGTMMAFLEPGDSLIVRRLPGGGLDVESSWTQGRVLIATPPLNDSVSYSREGK